MIRETKQLLRLRTLRVERAREGCTQAQAAVDAAAQAVQARQLAIRDAQRRMDAFAHSVVHNLAPRLPRWSDFAAAQRRRLADNLQREEYSLIDDEHTLEQAREKLQQARAELTRALAREDAVRGLASEAQREMLLLREQKLERESDEQVRRAR